MSTIRKLVSGIERKYIRNSILSPLFMIGEVVMEVIIPFIMAKIIDLGIANRDLPFVAKYGILMIGLACFSLLCGMLGTVFSTTAAQGFGYNLRKRLYAKVQSFSFANIDKFSTASLVTRLTTDVNMAQNVYRMMIQMCVRSPFMLVAGTLMAFKINSGLAVIFLVAIPAIIIAVIVIATIAFPRFSRMMKKIDVMNGTIQENLIGIRVVKAYVRTNFEEDKFRKAADDVRTTQVKAEKVVIFMIPIMQLTMYLTMIAVLWFGGNQVIRGTMLSGELISFFTYVTQVLMSIMMLGMVFVSIVMVQASNRRIVEVLDENSDITNPISPVEKVLDGSIKFTNVNFSYNKKGDNCVLKDINLEIKSGQVVGIIGGTGSSKTTLVSLLPRLYDVYSGTVEIGGEDVRKYDLKVLRDSVAIVLQKNILFSGTIKDNLKWGNENATDEQIVQACKAADADCFISSFPDGYDTELGQGGVNVSGGQKQRLCIARALLKNPKILILDDSTSAVDTATEGRIHETLKELVPDTTKIVIAQRISSVKDADVIFVLDEGKISGYGTHDELIANNEIYREVYESQQQGSGDADLF
ncbi:ABC transporter ATP-binding protein [Treponema sp. Marseille-Q3903]|uniref:ABC transporter ATP-binding protein n=1 Tax=Treponema sp. Marseille-Q3903 TaxID=2766703 RepID=UPI001652968C|nr:ABC transporter ATP-binding protein [Treponema sp. Marseille-Q3903]MBC6713167.1 ABC transporter ATP-binding protein [Treponema sp. Marseille-Q3903]